MGKKVSSKASRKGLKKAADTTVLQRTASNVVSVPGMVSVERSGGKSALNVATGRSGSAIRKTQAQLGLHGKKAQRKAY
jgi:hypothetical protein